MCEIIIKGFADWKAIFRDDINDIEFVFDELTENENLLCEKLSLLDKTGVEREILDRRIKLKELFLSLPESPEEKKPKSPAEITEMKKVRKKIDDILEDLERAQNNQIFTAKRDISAIEKEAKNQEEALKKEMTGLEKLVEEYATQEKKIKEKKEKNEKDGYKDASTIEDDIKDIEKVEGKIKSDFKEGIEKIAGKDGEPGELANFFNDESDLMYFFDEKNKNEMAQKKVDQYKNLIDYIKLHEQTIIDRWMARDVAEAVTAIADVAISIIAVKDEIVRVNSILASLGDKKNDAENTICSANQEIRKAKDSCARGDVEKIKSAEAKLKEILKKLEEIKL